MKPFISVYCSIYFFMFACQSGTDFVIESENLIVESEKELSHAPDGKVRIVAANVEADFGCDEYMASYILSEYGRATVDTVYTRGELIRFYEARHPGFQYGYSSLLNPYSDNGYVFPKLEYMLAQECFQDNCSSQTRKTVCV